MAEQCSGEIDELDAAYGEIHREHPFQDGPDFSMASRRLIDTPAFKFTLDFESRI